MKNKKIFQSRIKKIAVFRSLQLGDMLCVVPTLRALRVYYPHAKITLIGLPWAEEFVKRFHFYIDTFLAFPGFPQLPEQTVQIKVFPNFLQKVQKEKFDLALQLHGSGNITNLLITLFGAYYSAGYCTEKNYCPNPSTFFLYPENINETQKYLLLLKQLDIPTQGEYLEFPIHKIEQKQAEELIQKYFLNKKKYIILHPGARDTKRQNSFEIFKKIADFFGQKDYIIVLTGSEKEKGLCEKIAKSCQARQVTNLSGNTNLGVLAYILSHASLLISNDTGVSHIADAVKTPSVILFTSYSNPKRWTPLNTQLHKPLLPPYSSTQVYQAGELLLHLSNPEGGEYNAQ